MKHTHVYLAGLLLVSLTALAAAAARQKAMPREDVVEVPAIGQGLCVSNVFQSNMVLQRDKPLNIWGWAEPGEEVAVAFAGQEAKARAADPVENINIARKAPEIVQRLRAEL